MTVKIIIRVDDIKNRFDFQELKKWFVKNYPQIPVCFYACYTQYKYLWKKSGWRKIRQAIEEDKWEIGGHSRRHSHLEQIPEEELENEIGNNIKDIETGLDSVGLKYKVTSFAYPYGDFNENVKKKIKENGIFHGLTYINKEDYEPLIKFPENNLLEIGISCNASDSVEEWNKRFREIYENGDIYILCLHTPHWSRADKQKNILRILLARSIRAKHKLMRYFYRFYREENKIYMWNLLKQHIDYIISHKDVKFITFKELLKK